MARSTTRPPIPFSAREFVFVDPSVADLGVLLKGMRPQIAVSVLSGAEPTSGQMARVLAQHQGIDVLHIVAHGQPGEVSFAAGALSLESVDDHREDLGRIGSALSADGEIRLWVCEAAAGDNGAAFIAALMRNTGVPVAASTGRVGAAAHGGSWNLDARASDTALPLLTPEGIAAYAGVLATFNATTGVDDLDGGIGKDTFVVTDTNQIQAADRFDGSSGIDTVLVGTAFGVDVNLTAAAADGVNGFLNIEEIAFANAIGTSTVTLNADQFGVGKARSDATITGATGVQNLVVNLTTPGSFDLSALTFDTWTAGIDMVTVNGSSGADTITENPDTVDRVLAGAGDDTLIHIGPTVSALARYDGGDGTDTLQTVQSCDFSGAASDGVDGFINIEAIEFVDTSGGNTATFAAAQFGSGKISTTSKITGDTRTQGLVIHLAPGESLDLSGLSFSDWTDGTDTIIIDGSTGAERIVGTSQSDTIVTGGGGIDVLTGGGGLDTFIFTSADATLHIGGGGGNNGHVTGFGRITDFAPGATAATSELLGYTARTLGNSFTTNDSTLLLHTGATIKSHTINDGIVTFNDGTGSQSLITVGDIAAATQYLAANDWGTGGSTVAFTSTIAGVTDTYVYTQTTNNPGITNGAMVKLVNVSATGLVTNGTTLSVLDETGPNAPSITSIAENSGGGINAVEASNGTQVVVSLLGTGAISNDALTINWGGQTVTRALTGIDILAGSVTVRVPHLKILAQGDGTFDVTANLTNAASITSAVSPAISVTVDTNLTKAMLAIDLLISSSDVNAVPFTVSGLDLDATAVVHFNDGVHPQIDVFVPNAGSFTADLTGFSDGDITSSLTITDAVGNTRTHRGNTSPMVTGSTVSLSIPFYRELGADAAAQLADYSTVILESNGHGIAGLTVAEIESLGPAGVDFIHSVSDSFALSIDQYEALGTVAPTAADLVRLEGAGADLAAFNLIEIAALAGNGVDELDAVDNALSLSVAQFQALGAVALTGADVVTLTDTGANLAALGLAEIAALAGNGIDKLDAVDNVLSLSVAQLQALGTVALTGADVVTLTDTGANLAALSDVTFGALAGRRIDKLDASDGVLTLNAAQYLNLGTVQLTGSDTVTLADASASIQSLALAQFGDLAGKGIDRIDTSDNVLTLTAAKYEALGTVVLASADVVTVKDTGASLAGLDLGTLAGNGVDRLDASNDAMTLSVAQYQALGTVALTAADVVTLADTGADLSALGLAAIAALAGNGIDKLDAVDNALSLSVAQFQALGTVALTGADVVTLTDTGANLAALSDVEIGGLAGKKIDKLDASDEVLTLNAAQYLNLGTVQLTGPDTVTLEDTSASIQSLALAQFGDLAGKGIDKLDTSDNVLTLTAAKYEALGTVVLASADVVTVKDTGANLAGLDFATLAGNGVDKLDASNDILTLSLAQYQALGTVTLTAADVVTLADTGANLSAHGIAEIAALAGNGIDKLDAVDNALSLSVGQFQALGAVALTGADVVTLTDTGANLAALSDVEIGALAGKGVDHLDALDNLLSLSVAQYQALGTVVLSTTDAVIVTGTSGDDSITFNRQTFITADSIVGGPGSDSLTLNGDYPALSFGSTTIVDVERINLALGHSYGLTLVDDNVRAGAQLYVDGSDLSALESLFFDGSAETDGTFKLSGGAGSNTLTGGNGADQIIAGAGTDTIRYTAASQSTSVGHDTITGFNTDTDKFDVTPDLTGMDAPIAGTLSQATFDADLATAADAAHLSAHHAAIFTATAGDLAGHTFLLVDLNGTAGYHAGSDLVIETVGTVGANPINIHNFELL